MGLIRRKGGAAGWQVPSQLMIRLAAVVLFVVEVGSGFGVASASAVSMTDESMIIEIRVEVETSADSVVVHLALPDEDPITLPMLEREDGAYGVTTEVKPANYIVMFEAIGDPGAESDQVSHRSRKST